MSNLESRPWDGVEATGPWMRVKGAAEYLGISVSGYYEKAAEGVLPAPVKLYGQVSGVPRNYLDLVIRNAVAEAAR